MVRIALCPVHIGVQLVSCHELEQILCNRRRIRHSIVSLYYSAMLHVCPVVDCDCRMEIVIHNLLQRCQAIEYGVCIDSQYENLRRPFKLGRILNSGNLFLQHLIAYKTKNMIVISSHLFMFSHFNVKLVQFQSISHLVHNAPRAANAKKNVEVLLFVTV